MRIFVKMMLKYLFCLMLLAFFCAMGCSNTIAEKELIITDESLEEKGMSVPIDSAPEENSNGLVSKQKNAE